MILVDCFQFFNLKQILEIMSSDCMIYQLIPPEKFFYIIVARVDGHCPIMNNITFSTFENHSLSDITFLKNIIK